MANHASAAKRARQSEKRALRNRHVKSTVRSLVKRVRAAVKAGNKSDASVALAAAIRRIDQAVSKGVFHRKTGSRYVSRLSSQVAAAAK